MTYLLRLLDVRPTESRPLLSTFGSLLFIVIAHTTLETVRDAMFLAHVGPRGLGYMYIVTAVLTLAVGSVSAGISGRFGVRRALVVAQLASAAGAAVFCFLPPTMSVLTSLYAFSAVSGALLVPQLWATTATLFHAGQGRRLFGTIAMAGVLGAVVGTLTAAGALMVLDLRWLLLLSAAAFVLSSACVAAAPPARAARPAEKAAFEGSWWTAFKAEPFLPRIALVVALGGATTLFADYLVKAVVAVRVPPAQLGSFFARYYAAMNVAALLVQVLAARRVLARAGVVGTATLMPGLMLIGNVAGLLSGGAMLAVLATRIVDGALRHSVHRTGLELLYLALPSGARERARPIIDGAITRISQAAAAGLILLLTRTGRGSVREFAFVATCLAVAWVASSVSLRGPYVALFRRALLGPDHAEPRSPEELDLASVELLIEALSSPRPREVVAAMEALARRGRAGLLPGLVLLRREEDVLEHALELFGSSARGDWLHLCEPLLADRRERVRRAAMRALARGKHTLDPGRPGTPRASDRPWIRGYLAIAALGANVPPDADPLAGLTPDADGREARLGMLTALADGERDPRLADLVLRISEQVELHDREGVELVARAAARLGGAQLVPRLVKMLAVRDLGRSDDVHRPWRGPAEGRAVVRTALAALGPSAFEHLERTLLDERTPRPLRMHLPLTLAEFASQPAADLLFGFLQSGDDGFVRYRCLRALERMATDHGVRLPRREVRVVIRRELVEYFRLMGIRQGLTGLPGASSSDDGRNIVVRLLDDKSRQALARVFRLLQLCFPTEDLRQVQTAAESTDASTRATAVEFLDALLAPRRRHDHDGIRSLLRLVIDDLPDRERVTRAATAVDLGPLPESPRAAIALMRSGRDVLLAALATSLGEEYADLMPPQRETAGAGADQAALGVLRPLGAHGR